MLSYRHAFHAGNHADVLKHLTLVATLDYFNRKPTPYWYVDTHAGPGMYRLDAGPAAKNREFDSGIGRLRGAPGLPEPVARYIEVVGEDASHYPGSPELACRLMRDADRLWLYELHPADSEMLAAHF